MGIDLDLVQLRSAIRQASERAFSELRNAHPGEHFYTFALSTDDGLMTVVPAANSEEAWERKVAAGPALSSSEQNYYRWSPGEWAYEGVGGEHFRAAEALLNAPDQEDEDWDAEPSPEEARLRGEVIGTMTAALAGLDAAGFFGTGEAREGVTLFVSITDSDEAEQAEDESAQALNPAPVFQRFLKRNEEP